MANPEHVERLKAGVEEWNEWRRANPDALINLEGADLSHSNLDHVNLDHVNLDHVNLDYVNLSHANLCSAHLSCAYLWGADLVGASLSRAYLGNAQLSNAHLSGGRLSGGRLSGGHLSGADLWCTDLSDADLSDANLSDADLTNANLAIASVLGANFSGAVLTGACIEDWNINSQTNLAGIICEYIYLQQGQQKRRPLSGTFAPGDFARLVQKTVSTIDLIFRNGINWEAFAQSYEQLRIEAGSDELKIKSIEDKDDGGFVVRVNTPPGADNAKIQQFLEENYQKRLKAIEDRYRAQLQAKDEKLDIYRQENTNLWAIAQALATRPPSVTQNINAIYGGNAGSVGSAQNINPPPEP
ncbi:MAG: pentapeptide repeat-containing protein [Cyanobacteria bacterium P01_A01_bin.123]